MKPTANAMTESSDEQLLNLMAAGDEAAFAELIQRHAARLASLARRTIGAMAANEDIEEVVSDTFLQAWKIRELYDPARSAVRTWISWVLIAQALTKRRSLFRRQRIYAALRPEVTPSPEEPEQGFLAFDSDAVSRLQVALETLRATSPAEADLVERRYFKQQRPQEIALEYGISDSYARVKIFRALQRLRRLLAEASGNEAR